MIWKAKTFRHGCWSKVAHIFGVQVNTIQGVSSSQINVDPWLVAGLAMISKRISLVSITGIHPVGHKTVRQILLAA